MASYLATVSPGAAQQLTGAPLDAGSVIKNLDNTNSIWLADNPSVSPGNGILLNNLATVSWAKGNCYACVDTGVASPVFLQLSTDITNLDDPATLAAVVAAELIAEGIPTKYITTVLFNASVAPNSSTPLIDISEYSSFYVASSQDCLISQGMNVYEASVDFQGGNINNSSYPAIGNTLVVSNLSATTAANVTIYGSTRQPVIPHAFTADGYSSVGFYLSTGTIAWTAGQTVNLGGYISGNNAGQFFQGPCAMMLQTTATLTGYIGYEVDSIRRFMPVVDTKEGIVGSNSGQIVHALTAIPQGLTNMFFQPESSVAAGSVALQGIPFW